MDCCYNQPECIHNMGGKCDIFTCYDEYDMAKGKPFPNKEVEQYWTALKTKGEKVGYL